MVLRRVRVTVFGDPLTLITLGFSDDPFDDRHRSVGALHSWSQARADRWEGGKGIQPTELSSI
jgi:hypothetical protein